MKLEGIVLSEISHVSEATGCYLDVASKEAIPQKQRLD